MKKSKNKRKKRQDIVDSAYNKIESILKKSKLTNQEVLWILENFKKRLFEGIE